MKYDFDEVISRRGTLSYKWDSATDAEVLPLWVADMDFRTSPAIIEALQRRVAHGIFGYTRVPDAYYRKPPAPPARNPDGTPSSGPRNEVGHAMFRCS